MNRSKQKSNMPEKTDMKHMLLPRSTGLHYSLRALAPRIPDLRLLDMTVAYPGKMKFPRKNKDTYLIS